MDYKEILNLMKEMNNTDLTKLLIEEEGLKICIEKAAPIMNLTQPVLPQASFQQGIYPAIPMQPQVTVQTSVNEGIAAGTAGTDIQSEELAGTRLVAPMVGTFYASPAPDKPPFVKLGDKVKKGQTICIIEAMKLMNEIESELDGEIVKVLANNDEMVEFGQPLFLVK